MTTVYEIEVFYQQFAVYRTGDENLFPQWTDAHVQQGFAWRAESVGFGTLDDGPHEVEVRVCDLEEDAEAIRIIDLPLDVPVGNTLSLEAIFGVDVPLGVPPGSYTLRSEFFAPAEDKAQVRLTFAARVGAEHFEIVRADAGLEAQRPLLLTAEPAVESL